MNWKTNLKADENKDAHTQMIGWVKGSRYKREVYKKKPQYSRTKSTTTEQLKNLGRKKKELRKRTK